MFIANAFTVVRPAASGKAPELSSLRLPARRPEAPDWEAETRPVVFRSEAFAEDLDEREAVAA